MAWPAITYEAWSATCDTLHAHTQVLGKLAVELAPPEAQLQHAALRLTARGWETPTLPAPDGSGAIVVALDLRTHEAVVEHSNGGETRIPLTPNRPVADVTRDVLEAVRSLAGEVEINPAPQEVPWEMPLDRDTEHATYETEQVETYFAAATQAALVLAEFRAPYRGRMSPVNAWWGTFDLAAHLYSGRPADPPSDEFIMRNSARRTADRNRLVARRSEARRGGVLRIRVSDARGIRRGPDRPRRRALERGAGRVHPRLGRRAGRCRSARPRPRVRAVGISPRVRRVRLGS